MAYRVNEGNAAEEILRVANEIGSDLIVMGTHGRTGLRWLLAGSVAVAVLHGATCPVLAVRSIEQPRPAQEIEVILHPTDFSTDSEAALKVARQLAREHGARLIIAARRKESRSLVDGTPAADIDPRAYHDAIENVRKRVDGPDLKYPVETVLRHGYPAEEIVLTAHDMGCDLIVMGTHGRTGLSRLLMGSVAENVLPKANCPVLLVKAGQAASAPVSNESRPPRSPSIETVRRCWGRHLRVLAWAAMGAVAAIGVFNRRPRRTAMKNTDQELSLPTRNGPKRSDASVAEPGATRPSLLAKVADFVITVAIRAAQNHTACCLEESTP